MQFILLHAFPLDGSMWAEVAGTLRSQGHEVVTPDLRGFGTRPLGDHTPDLDRMVDDIVDVMGEAPAVVAGCSMGGYVALGLATRRPDLIEALVLVDTKATGDEEAARAHRERVAALAESGQDWSAGMIDGLLGATTRSTRPEVVSRVAEALRMASPRTVAWAQRAMAGRPDARATLSVLECPVLVIMGDEDTISPRSEQDLIVRAAPRATLHVIPGAGHLTPLEAPGEVAAALASITR